MALRSAARLPSLVLALSVLVSAGCGDGGEGGPTFEPLDTSDDFVRFEVDWQPDAVVVEATDVDAAILDADVAAGTFVFAPGVPAIDALAVGDPLVLGGVGIYRVTAVSDAGGERTITTAPAALGDVIADGELAWRESVVSRPVESKYGLGIGESDVGVIREHLEGSYADGTLAFSGTVAGFETSLSLTPAGDGFSLDLGSTFRSGETSASFAASGTIGGFTSEGAIAVRGGAVSELAVSLDQVRGDLLLEAGAVSVDGATKIEVPARLTVPILLGPIPFRVTLGGSIEIEVSTRVESTARVKARFRFAGSAGLRLEGGAIQGFGALTERSLTLEDSRSVSTASIGLGALMNFPEVGVGVGIVGTGADAFFRFKTETVSNFRVRLEPVGGFPVVTGNCLRVGVNLGATYGGSLQVFGFTLAESETPLYAQVNPEIERGDACDSL